MSNWMWMTAFLVLLGTKLALADDASKQVAGRVLDKAGRAAAGVTVAPGWVANGLRWDQIKEIQKTGKTEELWRNEGMMEPMGTRFATTDAEGQFKIGIRDNEKTLMALDVARSKGAIIRLSKGMENASFEVRLQPLVRVSGSTRLSGGDKPLQWSMVYLNLPPDPSDPLSRRRIGICGSFKTQFVFLVPPGEYVLSAFSDSPSAESVEDRPFKVVAGQTSLDLGTLLLRPSLTIQDRIDQSKARGTWVNYKENFGKAPPRWHLTDAKGVATGAELADFKEKWVILYIWAPNCAPCLGKGLPELMAFYEAHHSQRDRFEVLAFCVDFGGTLKTIRELENHLESVKKNVWGGKDLPFPVLLDNTFQTYERLGLEGSAVSNLLLINPEGKLVEGDLKTLERELSSSRNGSR
jgi:hypothetical protein